MRNKRIYFFRSSVKLLANSLKYFCYIFHLVFPEKRYDLASEGDTPVVSLNMQTIPRIIWQTNFTNRVTLPVYLNYCFNRRMALGYNYRFMTTGEREQFVREHYPARVFNAYSRLQIGAAQADFWRVLVLQKYGGVYMDIDAHLVWPLEKILAPDQEELFLQIKTGEISNYFIASKPNNPYLGEIINQILYNIENEVSQNVYDLTGPGVFNRVLSSLDVPKRYYLYTCNQGNFTNEYFQYLDKPQGKWTKEQGKVPVLKPKADLTH